jgi:hypothetical protein
MVCRVVEGVGYVGCWVRWVSFVFSRLLKADADLRPFTESGIR